MYSTDFNNFALQMLPPNYRLDAHTGWMQAQLAPMVWANDNFFEDFVNGSSYPDYNAGTTYGYQDRVISDHAVYESKQSGNTGNALTDSDWWFKVQDNYIGVYERIKYNSTKLILEFALNKWFGGTFKQPPDTSDIYITKNATNIRPFVTGDTTEASAVGYDISTGLDRKSTRLNSSHSAKSRMPSSA